MKVEVLYFGGCPSYVAAEETLREVLGGLGMDAEVEMVAVETDEEAARLASPAARPFASMGRICSPRVAPPSARIGD